MAAEIHQFTIEPAETEPSAADKAGFQMLHMGLKALSQRAVVALSSLFTLLTVGSAFVLWYVTPEPTPNQLIKLAMYGGFVLGANWIVRRR